VGSRSKFKFWEDEWLHNSQLKEKYPRIYNNSLIKDNQLIDSEVGLGKVGIGLSVGKGLVRMGKAYILKGFWFVYHNHLYIQIRKINGYGAIPHLIASQ